MVEGEEPVLPLATGNQPESHFSSLWIVRHRSEFDQTCQACHTVTNPGGTDNSSFCSNSACHGAAWEYADLDAPGLAEVIAEQEEAVATEEPPSPVPTGEPTGEPEEGEGLTWDGQIGALFADNCTTCHSGTAATGGLVLETYNDALLGGESGEVILPGNAEGSRLVQLQREGHFANFTDDELALIIEWIDSGAPEN
jgi:mono/diheme cytochrome c family protein